MARNGRVAEEGGPRARGAQEVPQLGRRSRGVLRGSVGAERWVDALELLGGDGVHLLAAVAHGRLRRLRRLLTLLLLLLLRALQAVTHLVVG